MTPPDRYGVRRVSKMYREWRRLADLCRAEGTPAIQEAIDEVEQHFDFAYGNAATQGRIAELEAEVARLRCAQASALEACEIIDAAVKEGHENLGGLVRHLLAAVGPARAALEAKQEEHP